jgi:hypothetical protein
MARILLIFLLIICKFYGQAQILEKPVKFTNYYSCLFKPEYTVNNFSIRGKINSFSIDQPQPIHRWKKVVFYTTFPLLVASYAAYSHDNKDLALGFASAALVTSSVSLVWYIQDRKK